MSRKLEIGANIAVVIVAVLASAVLVRNFLAPKKVQALRETIAVGTTLSLPGVDWRANTNTMILAVSTNCHYCSESAPFYRRLASELPRRRVHLTALLPQDAAEGQKYLRSLNVPVSDVRQAPLKKLKIRGTPTLLLVDERGIVRQVWEGMLSPERERQVFEAVGAMPARAAL